MRVKEIMNTFVVEIRPSDSVQHVVEAMQKESVGIVCVCDDLHVPVGVLTDRDVVIRGCAAGLSLPDTAAAELMTPKPLTCGPDDLAHDVEEAMKNARVGRILVVRDSGELAGIITLAEIWHYESPFAVGELSRQISERELRVNNTGGHFQVGETSTVEDDPSLEESK